MSATLPITGGCHCGAVRFAGRVEAAPELLDCTCSICAKTGFLHLIVPHAAMTIEGARHLVSYRFGTRAAQHLFCRTCGIKSFYQPRSHPEAWSVNYRALDPGHGLAPTIRVFDGRDWERARLELQG